MAKPPMNLDAVRRHHDHYSSPTVSNFPSRWLVVQLAETALYWAERADEAALRSIEASNPGIDMDEVRAHFERNK